MKTLSEVSRQFNIPLTTLQTAVKDGRLPATKLGRDWLINIDEPAFKQFLEKYRPRAKK